jgi:hypothetical protein
MSIDHGIHAIYSLIPHSLADCFDTGRRRSKEEKLLQAENDQKE